MLIVKKSYLRLIVFSFVFASHINIELPSSAEQRAQLVCISVLDASCMRVSPYWTPLPRNGGGRRTSMLLLAVRIEDVPSLHCIEEPSKTNTHDLPLSV